MKQKQSKGSVKEEVRDAPKQGMVEGIRKRERRINFTQIEKEFINQRWNELCSTMNDRSIAKEIANKTGCNAYSIRAVIDQLRKNKEIGENPNKRETRPMGFFGKMSDQELVEFAKKVIEERRIRGRMELNNADSGLYKVLCNRKLLALIFPAPEKKSESELLAQLKDAVELYLGKGEEG